MIKLYVIGPNGVGKTTLCEILVGNLQADSGEVLWGSNYSKLFYFPQNTTDIINGDMTLYDWLEVLIEMQILERLEIVLEECYLTVKSKRKSRFL